MSGEGDDDVADKLMVMAGRGREGGRARQLLTAGGLRLAA